MNRKHSKSPMVTNVVGLISVSDCDDTNSGFSGVLNRNVGAVPMIKSFFRF